MIYDMAKRPDSAEINQAVSRIRTRKRNHVQDLESKADIKFLTSFMTPEACEEVLNSALDLPWIPLKGSKVLTVRQLAVVTGRSRRTIHTILRRIPDGDRELIAFSNLTAIATRAVKEKTKSGLAVVLVFENGTTLFDAWSGRKFLVLNPRAVLQVIVSLSQGSDICNEVISAICDKVCDSDEWNISEADAREQAVQGIVNIITEATPDPVAIQVPVPQPIAEEASAMVPQPIMDPDQEPVHGPLDSIVLRFLNLLKPGTKIQIVVPA